MRSMIAAAVSALLGATPALAQEEKPFEGASVTAIAGVDATTPGGIRANFLYGAQAGYDVQSNALVYGVEVEANGRTRYGCVTSTQISTAAVIVAVATSISVGAWEQWLDVALWSTARSATPTGASATNINIP